MCIAKIKLASLCRSTTFLQTKTFTPDFGILWHCREHSEGAGREEKMNSEDCKLFFGKRPSKSGHPNS
uniref:Uncharacterized protein n=1 Tax=Oryza meridionalis TaxID=40149 RepID=A0A0E0DVZ9_9ORYZ